jgi:hypothetical protein
MATKKKSSAKKTSAKRKTPVERAAKKTPAKRKGAAKKTTAKRKSPAKRTAKKSPAKRKGASKRYGKKSQDKVGAAMHEMKQGKLRSGRSGRKVSSRKQAIAIGLSEARRSGGKVPAPKRKSNAR